MEKLQSSRQLSDCMRKHLNDYVDLHRFAKERQLCFDQLSLARDVAHDARSLAFEISLFPHLDESYPLLSRTRNVMLSYWHSIWSNSGVSEEEYRAAVKSAILFLEREYECSPVPNKFLTRTPSDLTAF